MDPTRRSSGLPPWSDAVLAAAFLAVSLAQVVVEPIAGPVISVLVAIGATVPLAWRRVRPVAAAVAGTAIWMIPTPHGFLLSGFVIAVLLFFSVGAYAPQLAQIVLVTAFGVVVGVVMTLVGPEDPPVAIGAALAVAAPAVAGRLVARYRMQNVRLRELSEELVRERTRTEQAAVAEERARIARELHDVIGHEISVIALQADAAAAALAKAPERAAVPVATIRTASASALAEMRRVVGLLREETAAEDRHPQPGLADLRELVATAQGAGTPVVLELRPPDEPLTPSLQLTVYRIVQEALTNARRHRAGSAVRVRIGADSSQICVEILSSSGRRVRAPGGGHGLIGMRERVRVHGGELTTGPTPDGFAVLARLPLALARRP